MYQTITLSNFTKNIRRIHDLVIIPTDPANTDYAAYLAWLAEGNEPEVIDL